MPVPPLASVPLVVSPEYAIMVAAMEEVVTIVVMGTMKDNMAKQIA